MALLISKGIHGPCLARALPVLPGTLEARRVSRVSGRGEDCPCAMLAASERPSRGSPRGDRIVRTVGWRPLVRIPGRFALSWGRLRESVVIKPIDRRLTHS